MSDLQYQWWSFKVFVPAEDNDGEGEGYEYIESEQGLTLEDAKDKYRREYPGCIVLAGGAEEED